MPFRALLATRRIAAFSCDDAQWIALVEASQLVPSQLTLPCCGAEAIPCTSPRNRRYFRHRTQASTCDWAPESPEHIDLKLEIAAAVVACGWTAEIEATGPDWKADVLATRGKATIALEVQLSAQGRTETELREERYLRSNVLPWWIVNKRNNGGGFGSERRSVLRGDDMDERIRNVGPDVRTFLRTVERHVDIAWAVKSALTSCGFKLVTESIGGIPSVFRITTPSDELQPLVIGEIGAGAIRNFDELVEDGDRAPWGAVAQFVKTSRQIPGFGATAFFLRDRDMQTEVAGIIGRLFGGQLRWVGRDDTDSVEASFVWYDDDCHTCGKSFVRLPYFICAHRSRWPKRPPFVYDFDRLEEDSQTRIVSRLQERLGQPLGTIVATRQRIFGERDHTDPLLQLCPHCGATASDTLIHASEALTWPHTAIDAMINFEVKESGWLRVRVPDDRVPPSGVAWADRLTAARETRQAARDEERRRRRIAAEEAKAAQEKWRQEQERRRQAAKDAAEREEAARQERLRQAQELHRAQVAAQREAKIAAARDRLHELTLRKCPDRQKAELWLKAHDPQLGGRPWDICADRFSACEKRLQTIRFP